MKFNLISTLPSKGKTYSQKEREIPSPEMSSLRESVVTIRSQSINSNFSEHRNK